MTHFFVALHKTSLAVPPCTPRSVLFVLPNSLRKFLQAAFVAIFVQRKARRRNCSPRATLTRSNDAMDKNRTNPQGFDNSRADTASFLLGVPRGYTSVVTPCPARELFRIATGGIFEVGLKLYSFEQIYII